GDVAKEGRTVLFVSHNMGAVNQLCTKAILLSNGEIKSSGSTNDVVQAYLSDNSLKSDVNIPLQTEKNVSITRVWLGNKEGNSIEVATTNEPFSIGVEFSISHN